MKTILLLSILSNATFSDIKIMTSEKSGLTEVTKEELVQVFLRKKDTIGGIKVIPIDNKESYREFYSKVIKKTPKQLRAYWIKTIDQKKPPKKLSPEEINKEMQKNSKIISYSKNSLTGKVLLTVK